MDERLRLQKGGGNCGTVVDPDIGSLLRSATFTIWKRKKETLSDENIRKGLENSSSSA
jgi:hypothetical protein